MGLLTIPDGGPIYMDTCGFIYSVERIEPYRTLIESVWRRAKTGQFVIVTSELSIMETIVNRCETATKCSKGSSEIFSTPARYGWFQPHAHYGKLPQRYAPL